MSNDLIVSFARRLRVTDRFAELVYATANYYARLRMKLSDREVKERMQQASAEMERLCIEHAVMQDLLENSSPADRTFEEAMERSEHLRERIYAVREEKQYEKQQRKTVAAAAAIEAQDLLHGNS